jgi:hypothetical protein
MGLGSGSRKKPIPDPGSRGQKPDPGSRIWIRNTGYAGQDHNMKYFIIAISYYKYVEKCTAISAHIVL